MLFFSGANSCNALSGVCEKRLIPLRRELKIAENDVGPVIAINPPRFPVNAVTKELVADFQLLAAAMMLAEVGFVVRAAMRLLNAFENALISDLTLAVE